MPYGQSVRAAPAHAEHREAVPPQSVGHRNGVVGHRQDSPFRMDARLPVAGTVESHDVGPDALEEAGVGTAIEPRSGCAVKSQERPAVGIAPGRPGDDPAVGSLDRRLR